MITEGKAYLLTASYFFLRNYLALWDNCTELLIKILKFYLDVQWFNANFNHKNQTLHSLKLIELQKDVMIAIKS